MSSEDPPQGVEIDERFLLEWVEFGWSELVAFLTKHANFDAWLREHEEEYP